MRVVSRDNHARTTTPGNVWLAAVELVRRHGGEAPAIAACRARACLDAGAVGQRLEWLRIRAAASALLEEDAE